MAYLEARGVGVVFPFKGPRRQGKLKGAAEEDRFVKTAAGRVVGLRALDDVSFTLADGDRLGLVGRNGSGKSTLLRVLGGSLPPDAGQVFAAGEVRAIYNLSVGSQAASTGRENILLSGLLAGRTRAEVLDREDEIVEFADIGRFIDMPFGSYSAGMKMRLLFAIATAFAPDVLLLDEWLSAGDAAFKKRARERMRAMADEAGVLVLASHHSEMLRATCNKALWIEQGRIRMFGGVNETIDAYDAFVADLMSDEAAETSDAAQ